MAGAFRKATNSLICRALRTNTASAVSGGSRLISHTSLPSLATRGLSRSFWYMSAAKKPSSVSTTPLGCSCCNFHTEADQELDTFLKREIKEEESKGTRKAPSVKGWSVETNDAIVKLQKTQGNETIVIKLNISNSVISPDDMMFDEEEITTPEPEKLECRPPFTIELKKSDGKTMLFDCSFRPPEGTFPEEAAGAADQEDVIADDFDIEEICIHDGEIKESTYKLDGQTMDEVMKDHLMNMLDERGINQDFTKELISMLTNYENGQYIKFLNNVKDFIGKN